MTQTFTTQFNDNKQRRIVLDKVACELEGLKKGDYVKVTIEKVKI